MSLNSEEILSKEFNYEKRGYSKSEVREFLELISNEFEKYSNKINDLKLETENLNISLNEYYQIDTSIRNALVFLRETEHDTITKTNDKVSEILNEAEEKSKKIIIEAEEEAKSTRDTLLFLKEQQEILVARLKIIIDSQEGMLRDFKAGNNQAHLQKSMAEANAFKAQAEFEIQSILEKLL